MIDYPDIRDRVPDKKDNKSQNLTSEPNDNLTRSNSSERKIYAEEQFNKDEINVLINLDLPNPDSTCNPIEISEYNKALSPPKNLFTIPPHLVQGPTYFPSSELKNPETQIKDEFNQPPYGDTISIQPSNAFTYAPYIQPMAQAPQLLPQQMYPGPQVTYQYAPVSDLIQSDQPQTQLQSVNTNINRVAPSFQRRVPPSTWSSHLFDCFNDIDTCLLSFLLPCVQFGLNAERLSGKSCYASCLGYSVCASFLLAFLPGQFLRGNIRDTFNIDGNMLQDMLFHYCCCPCAIAQEARELEVRLPSINANQMH